MKIKYLILFLVLGFTTISCEKWLNVQAEDSVLKDDLFKNGYGYRVALNGAFKQLGHTSLYGKNLTWGGTDIMGHIYLIASSKTPGISPNNTYAKLYDYDYEHNDVKNIYTEIWSKMYNNISNVNVIIESIKSAPAAIFEEKEDEKNAILGEAYALRGFMHFELLKYFAPAPIKNSKDKWIPYITKYPNTYSEYKTTKDIMELVIEDLKRGRDLAAQRDTINLSRISRLNSNSRFKSINDDMFFGSRGYRMNYGAVTGLLARAYNYIGDHKQAYDVVKEFFEFNNRNYDLWLFTNMWEVDINRKLSSEILFTVSDKKVSENYENMINFNHNSGLFLSFNPSELYGDVNDYRNSKLIQYNSSYNVYLSLKYLAPTITNEQYDIVKDMLPIMRLSEMWYILAESVALGGITAQVNGETFSGFNGAADIINKVKGKRYNNNKTQCSSIESFKREMIKEATREFIGEGQVFHYYKKFDVDIVDNMKDSWYYFPKVDI